MVCLYAYVDQILKQNLYVTEAYNIKAYAAAMDGVLSIFSFALFNYFLKLIV